MKSAYHYLKLHGNYGKWFITQNDEVKVSDRKNNQKDYVHIKSAHEAIASTAIVSTAIASTAIVDRPPPGSAHEAIASTVIISTAIASTAIA